MGLFSVNGKMQKTGKKHKVKIVNFTIPALQSINGFRTCPNAGLCATGCYARMGAYVFKGPRVKHEANLQATLKADFPIIAIAELTKLKPDLVRIHDAGDFYSREYLAKWIAIAIAMPDVKFYAYTKMVQLVKNTVLPDNLMIIFSQGGKQDLLINPNTDRHSRVFETVKELKAAGYVNASDDDMLASTINKRVGLVYHGNKNFVNTSWGKVKNKAA